MTHVQWLKCVSGTGILRISDVVPNRFKKTFLGLSFMKTERSGQIVLMMSWDSNVTRSSVTITHLLTHNHKFCREINVFVHHPDETGYPISNG